MYSIFILPQCCRSSGSAETFLSYFFVLIWKVSFKMVISPPGTDKQIFVAPLLLNEKNSFCPQFCVHSKTFWGQGGGCVLDQSLFWAQVLVLWTYSDWVVVTNPWLICVFLMFSRGSWITFIYFPYFFRSPSSHALVVPLSLPSCNQVTIPEEMYTTERAAVQKVSTYLSYRFSIVSFFWGRPVCCARAYFLSLQCFSLDSLHHWLVFWVSI